MAFWMRFGCYFSPKISLKSLGKPQPEINFSSKVDKLTLHPICQVDATQWRDPHGSSTCGGSGGSTHRWASCTDATGRCRNGTGTGGTGRIVDLHRGVLVALRFRGDVDVSRHPEVLGLDEGNEDWKTVHFDAGKGS